MAASHWPLTQFHPSHFHDSHWALDLAPAPAAGDAVWTYVTDDQEVFVYG